MTLSLAIAQAALRHDVQTAVTRNLRIKHLRHRITGLENEAEASEQHARALRDEALDLRGELYALEDGDPGTLSE
jgi:predicted  nucleic acid-binding Zn-ribbon protein